MDTMMMVAQVIGLAVMMLSGVGVVLRVASWAVDKWLDNRQRTRRWTFERF